ncbi:MAG: hypothetical protein U0414_14140 [Polyangiaceae bacterium]
MKRPPVFKGKVNGVPSVGAGGAWDAGMASSAWIRVCGVVGVFVGVGCGGAQTEATDHGTSGPSSSVSAPSTTQGTPEPTSSAAPASSSSCVEQCFQSRQMQAIAVEQIRKNCEEECKAK